MPSIAPGWYPDPDRSAPAGQMRWYSGEGWTQHVDVPVVVPAPAGPTVVPESAFPVAPQYPAQQAEIAGLPMQVAVMPQQPVADQVPQPWGPPPQTGTAYPPMYTAPGYGTPAAQFGSPVGAGTAPRIAVGSMSRAEFKALPRKVRNAKDRPDIDLALGTNRPAKDALIYGIISMVFNPLLVFSIVAIVRATQGMNRAKAWSADGYPPLGHQKAVAGLVLGIIATALWPLALWLRISSGGM